MSLDQKSYDAIVVGGGPAGLVAATYLARFRRRVLLVDAGSSRVATIPRSYNYPGFADGLPGVQLLASLRAQVDRYAVDTASGLVEQAERRGSGFRVDWPGGSAVGRTLLLATGASDIAPDMPYAVDALRDGLLRYCPVCDGFEVVDKAVGVLVNGSSGVHEALYLRHFTPHLTVFRAGAGVQVGEDERRQLAAGGIVLASEPAGSIRMWDSRITVRHGDTETACDSVYCALGMRVHSDLATRLGAEADGDGYLAIDRHHRTTVRGLYAAGDVAQGLNQISVAEGGAAIAASAMHLALGMP
jgi:thioredoxin reductase (NADPH)